MVEALNKFISKQLECPVQGQGIFTIDFIAPVSVISCKITFCNHHDIDIISVEINEFFTEIHNGNNKKFSGNDIKMKLNLNENKLLEAHHSFWFSWHSVFKIF